MRILHIMNWFRENMGYQENYLPFYQAGLGHSVRILCSEHFLKKRDFAENTGSDIIYNDRPLEIKRLQSLYIRHFVEQNWYLNFSKEINSFNPDVVHLHNFWSLPALQFLVTHLIDKRKIKVFTDSHIDNGNFEYKKIHKAIYYFGVVKKLTIPYMLKRNFLFLAVNPYARYCLNSYFDVPHDKIRDLFLGVDSDNIFFSLTERQKMRASFSIKSDDIVFIYSGVFEESKALDDLIIAFKHLSNKYPNIFLLMVGRGVILHGREFTSLINQGKVILPGWQHIYELHRWYSLADVGVLPGKLGGVREVLAVGRPLIISNDLAVSYLNEYENGVVFKRGDVKELENAMELYVKNPQLIKQHGERSLRLVNDKLSWRNVAMKSLQIYQAL